LEPGLARGLYQGVVSDLLEPSLNENSQPQPLGKRVLGVLFFLGVAGLLLWGAFRWDAYVVTLVRENANGTGRWLAGRISYWGDWYGVLAIGVVLWWAGKKWRSPEWRRLVLLMGLCSVIAGLSANKIRALTGRARPFTEAAPGWYGPAKGARFWTKGARDFQSFPSAHTSVVAGFFAPLALVALRSRRRVWRWLGVAVAFSGTALMAWARVWAGAHHLSDVTAASLLGLVVGVFVLRRAAF
jgi:membrane-associated phospholipid phosphatase